MQDRPKHLPDFGKPPLVEVVLDVQFAPLPDFGAVHLGLLYQAFKERYPNFKEHNPLPQSFETFGGADVPPERPKIQFVDSPEAPRVWFFAEPDHHLLQVQNGRFVHNWRKMGVEGGNVEDYPRYEHIRDCFIFEFNEFERGLVELGFEGVSINQCEVTYINHIDVSDIAPDSGKQTPFAKAFGWWCDVPRATDEIELEYQHFRISNIISREDERIGRLNVRADPALSKDGKQIVRLQLAARGVPSGENLEDALEFMDMGRELIVTHFSNITSKECQAAWERTS